MYSLLLPAFIGLNILLISVNAFQYIRYRITIKEKSLNINYQEREHARLAGELEQTLKKNLVLEEILKSMLNQKKHFRKNNDSNFYQTNPTNPVLPLYQ